MGHCHGDIASSPRLARPLNTSDSTVLNTHWDPAAELNVPEACHGVCSACFQLPQSTGGSVLWRARNSNQDVGFLWGLRSYPAASTDPAQLHPG